MSGLPLDSLLGIVVGCAVALLWVVRLRGFATTTSTLPSLDPRSHLQPPPGAGAEPAPRISVVVAAKDEEENIESCVRSILAQDHSAFDLTVVNDRSRDRTGEILAGLCGEFAGRLRVITVDVLPDGWGGQNHALRQGVAASGGDWLCFTDADCRLDSVRTLTIAAREAAASGADLLSILPRMEAPTLWERCYLPLCCLVFMMRLRIGEVNRAESPAAYANGAFMLVRRPVYEELGGHGRVKNELNDDIALAAMAKRQGFRIRIAGNTGLCRTRMYGSIRRAWDGWTRNFCGTLATPRALLGALATMLVLFVLPWLGLGSALARPAGAGAVALAVAWGAAVLIAHAGMWAAYPFFGSSAWQSLLYPPGALFVAAIVSRAAIRSLRRTGTIWQGAHYRPRAR
jgi:chlorobactene glucosyltransferase